MFFTLFPYWIDFSAKHASSRSPFLLGGPLRFDGIAHTFLNALLFAPFGFALSQCFARYRKSFLNSLFLGVLLGGALSYAIEFVQLYMPSRDSAWDDVLANAFGTLVGMLFGLVFGGFIFRKLSEWEASLELHLSLRIISSVILIYFGIWLVISVPLQQKTRLNNWDPNSFLLAGYDIQEDSLWSGAVSRIQLWDRALSASEAVGLSGRAVARSEPIAAPVRGLLASYDFSQLPRVQDETGQLPSLAPRPVTGSPISDERSALNKASAGFISQASVPSISAAVRFSNQVTVLLDCVPKRGNDTDGAIFEVENMSGKPNLILWQERTLLVIALRNGLDTKKAHLAWVIPGVFTANVRHVIIYSYDGARASLYVDGREQRHSYYLSPGAALVEKFIRIKTDELVAYSALYDSLVFLPIGFLIGFAVRITPRRNTFYKLGICAGVLLPPLILEAMLVGISGRKASIPLVCLSVGITIAGMFWMNLDPRNTA